MTSKEAKKVLNEYRNRNYSSTLKVKVELAKAIDVILPKYVDLEARDTPKKIVNVGAGIDNKDPYYHCGKCRREMPNANKYFLKYCANCGQRLDWSNENE